MGQVRAAIRPKWDAVWLDYIQKIKTYVQQGQDAQLPDNIGFKQFNKAAACSLKAKP